MSVIQRACKYTSFFPPALLLLLTLSLVLCALLLCTCVVDLPTLSDAELSAGCQLANPVTFV